MGYQGLWGKLKIDSKIEKKIMKKCEKNLGICIQCTRHNLDHVFKIYPTFYYNN